MTKNKDIVLHLKFRIMVIRKKGILGRLRSKEKQRSLSISSI